MAFLFLGILDITTRVLTFGQSWPLNHKRNIICPYIRISILKHGMVEFMSPKVRRLNQNRFILV